MLRLIFLSICIAVVLYGCAPTTQITGSWNNPNIPDQAYDRVFVAALTSDVGAKQVMEDQLAEALERQGIRTGKASDVFSPNFTDNDAQDKEKLLSKIRDDKYDAILTISLIDKDSETRYVPGNYAYSPVARYRWYGDFWGYYTYWYPSIYEPGYYTQDRVYFIETNLYDAGSEKLVWSGQSESYNPTDLEMFSEDYAEVIVDELGDEALIRPS